MDYLTRIRNEPALKELKPDYREKRAIQEIFNWLESSKSSQSIDDFLQRAQEHSIACDCSKDYTCD